MIVTDQEIEVIKDRHHKVTAALRRLQEEYLEAVENTELEEKRALLTADGTVPEKQAKAKIAAEEKKLDEIKKKVVFDNAKLQLKHYELVIEIWRTESANLRGIT